MSETVFDVTEETFDSVVIAGSQQVPVLVDFWAEWCNPCQMLMPVLKQLAESYGGKFILAKVNSDQQQSLAQRYGVRSLPTVKLFRNGEPVDEFMGALPEPAIREFLDKHIERASDAMRAQATELMKRGEKREAVALLQTAFAEDPDNLRVPADLIEALILSGEFEQARAVFNTLPANIQTDDPFHAQEEKIGFAEVAAAGGDVDELQARITADADDLEARYALSAHYVANQEYGPALEQLLEILKRDRSYRDDAGRKGMLSIFDILGNEHPYVAEYRPKLSAVLF